jgi:hypothetical protein
VFKADCSSQPLFTNLCGCVLGIRRSTQGWSLKRQGNPLRFSSSKIFHKEITDRNVNINVHELVARRGIYLLLWRQGNRSYGLIATHHFQRYPRVLTHHTETYFPIFPSSCYAPYYSVLTCIPLELLRSPLQRTSLYSPRAVTLHTETYLPIFPSSHLAILFTGILVITINTSLPYGSAGFWLGLILYPEDGDDTFLRNVGVPPNHTLQPRGLYCS